MESLILKVIQENKDWERIIKSNDISFKQDGDYIIFNYNITADFHKPLVQEARGIIINLREMKVVCWPFRKFGNFGEDYVDNIDWKSARVQDKIDGSIIKVWWDNKVWHTSTNSTIDAKKAPVNTEINFYDVFNRAKIECGLGFNRLNRNYTYMFELISPYNRVVVDYNKIDLYHIGTRDNRTGLELNEDIGIKKPAEYPLHSLEDCIDAAAKLNPHGETIRKEGFVVVDKYWNRIKIKSPEYVAIHRLIPNGMISDYQLFEMIRNGVIDDVVSYVPSLKPRIVGIIKRYKDFRDKVNEYLICNAELVDRENLSRKDWCVAHKSDKFFSFGVKWIFDKKEPDYEQLSTKKIWQMMEG